MFFKNKFHHSCAWNGLLVKNEILTIWLNCAIHRWVWNIVKHLRWSYFFQKLYFVKSCILDFWLSFECTSAKFDLSAKWYIFLICPGPPTRDRVVGVGNHDSSNIVNLYFWHSRFQGRLLVCHCRRYSIADPSIYIIWSGVLMSIQPGQKIKPKKIMWSALFYSRIFAKEERWRYRYRPWWNFLILLK